MSIRLSIRLSPPIPLDGIYPNLLYDFLSCKGCERASPSICPGKHLRLEGYFRQDNEVYFVLYTLTSLKPVSLGATQLCKFKIEVAPKTKHVRMSIRHAISNISMECGIWDGT